MSELSRQARRAMRAKIHRITKGESGKVDASDYGPEEVLNAGVKTGLRPISRRAFKKGGKVVANEGKDAVKHAGKKARSKPKHLTIDALINRNVKDANEDREGIKHVGGLKTGGRAKKNTGGPLDAMGGDLYGMKNAPAMSRAAKAAGLKKGGRAERWLGGANTRKTPPAPTPTSTPSASTMPRTEEVDSMGRDELKALGRSAAEDAKKPIVPGRRKSGGRAWEGSAKDEAQDKKLAKKHGMSMKKWEASSLDKKHDKQHSMKGLKSGGMAMDGEYQGTRPTGGRLAKKDGGSLAGLEMNKGGRAKGKTNINIVIATGKGQPQDQMAPPMSQRPGGIPVAVPPQGAGAPPMPAAPAPMPMPPAGGLGGAGPMGAAPMPRKAGGRTYRSYKDMDAGAGSGLGRLEKTEIQKHKK